MCNIIHKCKSFTPTCQIFYDCIYISCHVYFGFIVTFAQHIQHVCIYFKNTLTRPLYKKSMCKCKSYCNTLKKVCTLHLDPLSKEILVWKTWRCYISHFSLVVRVFYHKVGPQQKQDHKGEFNLKQVPDGSCNNARSCKMIIVPPFKLAKFVIEEEQHEQACFKP
jgi:hypothetical protein